MIDENISKSCPFHSSIDYTKKIIPVGRRMQIGTIVPICGLSVGASIGASNSGNGQRRQPVARRLYRQGKGE
jgi:hypothetical protein